MVNKKIHILDDDKMSTFLLRKLIEKIGDEFEIQVSISFDEALPKLQLGCDVLFLDQNLKDYTGEECLISFKNKGLTKMKVVLISSHFNDHQLSLSQDFTNIIGNIIKPFSVDKIKDFI